MSMIARIGAATAAGWVRMSLMVVIQIFATPILLTKWTSRQYGVWLVLLALQSAIEMADSAAQDYFGFEYLRIGVQRFVELNKLFWTSIAVLPFLGGIQLMIVISLRYTGALSRLLGLKEADFATADQMFFLLLILVMVNLIFNSTGGLVVRLMAPLRRYVWCAWASVGFLIVIGAIPPLSAFMGGNVVQTGYIYALAIAVMNVPMLWIAWRIILTAGFRPVKPDIRLGLRGLAKAQIITLRNSSEMLRQQGVRLLLVPLSGANGLVAFATMRTGANVALQGLGTITNPFLPELMRFLNARDQARSEAAFGTVWTVVVAVMAPAAVILQAFFGPLFHLWTRGKVPFNPTLFALLSLGVLVYGAAQPAMAIMHGNNLLRPQLIISVASGAAVLCGLFILVPKVGIVGAGWALLAGEMIATCGYRLVSADWLAKHGLQWPHRASRQVLASVATAGVAMLLIAWYPNQRWLILTIGLASLAAFFIRYWNHLPMLVKERTAELRVRILKAGQIRLQGFDRTA